MTRRLFIAVPAYTGRVCTQTMQTVIDGMLEANRSGFEGCVVTTYDGDGRIVNVRNKIANDFLYSGFSDLLMLDHDVAAEPGSVGRILSYPVDFVAGVYRAKKEEERYNMRWLGSEREGWHLEEDPATGLIEAAAVPAGFLRVSRNCIQRMVAHYTKGAYLNGDLSNGIGDKALRTGKVSRLFNDWPLEDEDWGEDFAFCRRWREIGGKVWVDPTLKLIHIGDKNYEGCVKAWLIKHAATNSLTRVPVTQAA